MTESFEPAAGAAEAACYRHPDRRAGVKCQRCGNDICGSCMTTASVGFHCPSCLKRDGQQVMNRQNGFGAAQPYLTMAIIAVNALIFLAQMAGANTLESDFLLNVAPVEGGGEWWRILTSGFLHGGLIHIGFNMYLLWMLGQSLEQRFGIFTYGATYLAGLLGGSLGAMLIEPTASVVGASGAVFALMGLVAVLQRKGGINIWQSGIGGLVLINIMFSFTPGISLGGHAGGLVAGVLSGVLLTEVVPRLNIKSKWIETAVILALVAVLAIALLPALDRACDISNFCR